jgi:protein-S-isoprenylcysteine O-methyltransferase Ste14
MTLHLVCVWLYLATLAGRCLYEHLKRRGRVDASSRRVFAIVFADMAALWASWFTMAAVDPFKVELPAPVRWAGLTLTIIGAALFLGALLQLRALENTKVLVTGGLFAKIRHPIYCGFVLWFVAWPVFCAAPISLALAIPGVVCIFIWRHLEERALVLQFGPAYVEYRQRTWF